MSWEDEFDPDALIAQITGGENAAPAPSATGEEVDLTVLEALKAPAEPPPPSGPAQPETVKAKHIKKEMQRKEIEAARKRLEEEGVPLSDPRQEELRRRALQEKADLEMAVDSLALKGLDDTTLIGLMAFADDADFEDNAIAMAKKALGASGLKHTNAVVFFKKMLEFASESLTVEELKDIGKVITKAADKKAAEKKAATAAAKAPAPAKKAKAKVYIERDNDYDYADDYGDDEYADVGAGAVEATESEKPAAAQPDASTSKKNMR